MNLGAHLMTDREIMQQALDMLVEPHPHIRTSFTDSIKYREKINQVIESLRQALAQPEQEPVALNKNMTLGCPAYLHGLAQPEQEPKLSDAGVDTNIPLWGLEPKGSGMVALHQREWVGLTEEERNEMIGRIQHDQYTRQRDLIGSTQIITEMYLKDKNT